MLFPNQLQDVMMLNLLCLPCIFFSCSWLHFLAVIFNCDQVANKTGAKTFAFFFHFTNCWLTVWVFPTLSVFISWANPFQISPIQPRGKVLICGIDCSTKTAPAVCFLVPAALNLYLQSHSCLMYAHICIETQVSIVEFILESQQILLKHALQHTVSMSTIKYPSIWIPCFIVWAVTVAQENDQHVSENKFVDLNSFHVACWVNFCFRWGIFSNRKVDGT